MLANQVSLDRGAWVSRAVAAGFIAVSAMSVMTLLLAIPLAFLGSQAVNEFANQVLRYPLNMIVMGWLYAIRDNSLVQQGGGALAFVLGIHLSMGLFWAIVYAAVFADRLPGKGWQRGLTFSWLPCLLSLVVFFPIVGAGIGGFGIGAGPLLLIGTVLVHVVYGITLGSVYSLPDVEGRSWMSEQENTESERRAAVGAQQGIAYGLVGGIAVGVILALIGSAVGGISSSAGAFLAVGSLCGALGVMIGSIYGISRNAS